MMLFFVCAVMVYICIYPNSGCWLVKKPLRYPVYLWSNGYGADHRRVSNAQEFSVFAFVSVLSDFFMQVTFFTTVLSIDIRRMELADLQTHHQRVSDVCGFVVEIAMPRTHLCIHEALVYPAYIEVT